MQTICINNVGNVKVVNVITTSIPKPLTEKQKSFCARIIEGSSPAAAYQQVYGCKPASAIASGARLLTNVGVRKHLDRLRSVCESRSILSRLEKLEALSAMVLREGRYGDASVADARAAIHESNKMEGHLAPEKMVTATLNLNELLAGSDDSENGWLDCE